MELAPATSLELLVAAFFSSLLISVIVIVGSRYIAGSRSSSSSPTKRRFRDLALLFEEDAIFALDGRFVAVLGTDLGVVLIVVDGLVPDGLEEVDFATDLGVLDFVVVSVFGFMDTEFL